jgi:hypothetical protein
MTLDGGILMTLYREQREFEARSPTTQATLFILEFSHPGTGTNVAQPGQLGVHIKASESQTQRDELAEERLNRNAKPLFALLINSLE